VGVGEAGEREEQRGRPRDSEGGRAETVHRFAAAWVRVRAAFGDG